MATTVPAKTAAATCACRPVAVKPSMIPSGIVE
jgi:hypothetical protein